MFEWKVEDMKLMQPNSGYMTFGDNIKFYKYKCEDEVSREDKIAFVDESSNGALTYILNLAKKLDEERESMPKDKWGDIKTVSLKAWIKRNISDDAPVRICTEPSNYIGEFYICGCKRRIQNVNTRGIWDAYKDIVDQAFHDALRQCETTEKQYFNEHDEYTILKKELRDKSYKYATTFGVHLMYFSNDKIFVCSDEDEKREITIDEIKELLAKYDELKKTIDKLTAETHIEY